MAQYSPSSYASVARHGAKFFRALGWKRTLTAQGLGLLSTSLYALGLASLVPVLSVLGGGKAGALPQVVTHALSYFPFIQQHGLVGPVLLSTTLVIFLLRSVCLSLYYGYGGRITEKYTRGVRNNILITYAQDREHYASENAKTKILYFNSQLPQLSSFNWGIIYCSLQLYTLAVLIAANVYLSPAASVVSLVIGLIIVPLTRPLLRGISAAGSALNSINHKVLTASNNFTEGFETITTLNMRDNLQDDIDRLGADAMDKQLHLGILQGIIAALPEILISIVAIGFYWALGAGGVNGPLIAMSGYSIVRLVGTLGQLNEKLGDLTKLTAIPDELSAFLDVSRAAHTARHRSNLVTLERPLAQIHFDDVSVSVSGRPLFSDVSLTFDKVGIYQLAGPNGSGKSTLLRALAGLMPYKGSITIQGHEVSGLTRESLTAFISYHSQENFLLEGTFLENVLLGNSEKTAADVQTLLKKMELDNHPLFARGLDFPIAETASNLSGGERQFICVLRTLLRDTPIYLFDEYTNHLSLTVAERLGVHIRGLSEKIVVIVSHANLHLADVVVSMNHGRVTKVENQNMAPA